MPSICVKPQMSLDKEMTDLATLEFEFLNFPAVVVKDPSSLEVFFEDCRHG